MSIGFVRLVLATAVIAVAWLVALPRIARLPAQNKSWRALEASGIDPSAMYYSELEAMEPILNRLNLGERMEASNSHASAHVMPTQ
jgi:hypothetical protein